MDTLFLAWQDPKKKKLFPIGRLISWDKYYQFNYTKGALIAKKESHFHELASFPSLEKVYVSEELFPVFSNRVLPRSRPEYKDYLKWMSVAQGQDDPMLLLARSGGKRVTDNLQVFSSPQLDQNGNYFIHFFAEDMDSLSKDSLKSIESLNVGETLLVNEVQSSGNKKVVLVKGNEMKEPEILGYLPSFLMENWVEIIKDGDWYVSVQGINLPPAPLQFRLLCRMTFAQHINFQPFTNEIYQPISSTS
ncbi:MAG: DNA-binding protein [Blastocatellia bacterium]